MDREWLAEREREKEKDTQRDRKREIQRERERGKVVGLSDNRFTGIDSKLGRVRAGKSDFPSDFFLRSRRNFDEFS